MGGIATVSSTAAEQARVPETALLSASQILIFCSKFDIEVFMGSLVLRLFFFLPLTLFSGESNTT